MQTTTDVTPADAAPATIAGFWRRLGAFVIDMLVLGAAGAVLGWLFHDQFARLGAWDRAVGFVVSLAYFGLLESARGGGRSLGKRALGLQVVTRTGAMLGAPAAFLRSAIFCLAYFLNGVGTAPRPGSAWITFVQAILIGALVVGVFYILLFNRRTRQGVHDLAVGAWVVKTGPGAFAPPALPVWRGHYAIAGGAVLVLSAGGMLLLKQHTIGALLATQQAIGALPDVDRVTVNINVQVAGPNRAGSLQLGGVVDASLGDPEGLATTMANIALDTYPGAKAQQQIIVTLSSGYDIGIASDWRWTRYVWSPAQWRALARKQTT